MELQEYVDLIEEAQSHIADIHTRFAYNMTDETKRDLLASAHAVIAAMSHLFPALSPARPEPLAERAARPAERYVHAGVLLKLDVPFEIKFAGGWETVQMVENGEDRVGVYDAAGRLMSWLLKTSEVRVRGGRKA